MLRNTPHKFLLAVVFTLPLAYGFIWIHEKATAQKDQPNSATHSDRPVELVWKNIQVLKGVPKSQFPRSMDFMTAALGVDCDYCHVPAWESDDKPAKEVTRKMILMMREINDKNFNGKLVVNCATCHQGHPKPLAEPPLDQVALRSRFPQPSMKPDAIATLPSVDSIIDRYVEALGGKSAFEKLKTRLIKSTLSMGDGKTASQEVYMKEPHKAVFITTTGTETTSYGFSGATGWLKTSRVRRELSGPLLDQLRFNSEFNREIRFKELFIELRVLGKEKIGTREVYVVQAKPIYSDPRRFYFDIESGLLLRTVIEEVSILGSVLDQIDFSDYRSVNGIKLPFQIQRTSLWENSVTKIVELKHNVPISDAKFEMPAQ